MSQLMGRRSLQSRLIQRIEQVELRVRDVAAAAAFYRDVAGLRVIEQESERAVLGDAAGRALLSLDSRGVGQPADPYSTGLFHTAIRFPTRAALGNALSRVVAAGLQIGAGDHLVSEALYIDDADGNGVELYWDRPVEEWPPPTETMAIPMATLPVDLDSLLGEGAGQDAVGGPAPAGTDIGHVHLQISDLASSIGFYVGVLGLDQTASLAGSAAFFSSNGYHHHLGANIWRSRGARPAPKHRAGLARVVFSVGSSAEVSDLAGRLRDAGRRAEETEPGRLTVWDPDGIELIFVAAGDR